MFLEKKFSGWKRDYLAMETLQVLEILGISCLRSNHWVNWAVEYPWFLKLIIFIADMTRWPNLLKYICLNGKHSVMTLQGSIFSLLRSIFLKSSISVKNYDEYCLCSSLSSLWCSNKTSLRKFSIAWIPAEIISGWSQIFSPTLVPSCRINFKLFVNHTLVSKVFTIKAVPGDFTWLRKLTCTHLLSSLYVHDLLYKWLFRIAHIFSRTYRHASLTFTNFLSVTITVGFMALFSIIKRIHRHIYSF